MATVLALDVGGTKLAAAVVDDAGRILGRGRVPSPTGTDPEQLYEALLACAAAALRGADVIPGDLDGIGVAAAGPMVWPSGEVSPLNMPAWRGFPLRKRLAERVRLRPRPDPQRRGRPDRGRALEGRRVRAPPTCSASPSPPGSAAASSSTAASTTASAATPAMSATSSSSSTARPAPAAGAAAWRRSRQGPTPCATPWTTAGGPDPGSVADGVALAAAAAAGDEIALRNVARAGRAVGTAIASCASLLDLEVAAIVGGFSQSGPSFWEPLHQAFTTHAGFPFAAACRVVPGQLGEAAGLLGAAAFVLDPDRYGWDPDPARGH